MNKIKARQFISLLIFIIIAACAKISSPSGGARDRTPPQVLESNPNDGAVNFKGNKISVTFDEYVVLDRINDKFMVSPPMKKKPRVYTRGKSVRVEYDDELKDSTTYTFYFTDAIRDLNEGNIIPNFKIAFSTGSFIDSLSVTGNVYTLPDLNPPEATLVLMYSNHEDSAAVKLFPDYLSRVDEKGYFRIDNIREGSYRLYALKDEDNSRNYNRLEEPFGFLDTVITVTPENNYLPEEPDTVPVLSPQVKKPAAPAPVKITKTTAQTVTKTEQDEVPEKKGQYRIMLFAAQKAARYLSGTSRPVGYKLMYFLSLPPDTMNFNFRISDVAPEKYFLETTPSRDTLTVWITDSTVYSQPVLTTIFKYPFTDSLGVHGYREDSISMRYTTPRAPRGGVKKRMLRLTNNITPGILKPGQKIAFASETPLNDPDTSRIRLFEVNEKERLPVRYSFLRDSSYSGKLTLKAILNQGKQYLFVADSASISNIYNEHIDSTGIRFSVREVSSYSKLELDIINAGERCIIELMDNNEKLLATSVPGADGKVVFSLLEKGTYRLRAISDINGDGKWTTGDFFTRRQPEPVTYFPKEVEIPEGWDVKEKWDISEKNYKPQALRSTPKANK